MAGVAGKSGPPGNANAFKHGLGAIDKCRQNGALTIQGETVRREILDGLLSDKGGQDRVSTAMAVLAEVIAADAAWLTVFNGAIDNVITNNQKARSNPKALAQLDSYKRGLVNSLTANLQRFGFDRIAKVQTLAEIIDEMTEGDEKDGNSTAHEA